MAANLIVTSNLDRDLSPAPINPAWIRAGQPAARNALLAKSADGGGATYLWECTAGTFDWHYGFDETLYILEGSVVIETDTMGPTRYGPGDVIAFMSGARARWHIEAYIRKLAFCRRPEPRVLKLARAVWNRVKAFGRPARRAPAGAEGSMLSAS